MIWNGALLLAAALTTGAAPVPVDDELLRLEPGPDAAAAYAAFDSGDRSRACETLLHQLRDGSSDPWAYRGGAICAKQVEGFRQPFEAAVGESRGGRALESWGRAYLAFLDENLQVAEDELRKTVELEPIFPLAWNLLGVVLERQERHDEALAAYEESLDLSPGFGFAGGNLRRVISHRLRSLVPDLQQARRALAEGAGAAPGVAPVDRFTGLAQEGRFDRETADALETARDLLKATQERLGGASAWLEEGKLLLALGFPERAREAIKRARELYQEEGDAAGVAASVSEEEKTVIQLESREGAVFDRLSSLLTDLAEEWHGLPQPSLPYSSHDQVTILSNIDTGARREEYQDVKRQLTRLIVASPREREKLSKKWAAAEALDEVGLWLPAFLVEGELESKPVESALALEAWMALGRATNRQDVLLHGVRLTLEAIAERTGTESALELARSWQEVATTTEGFPRPRARIFETVGEILVQAGRNEQALAPYRKAKQLFRAIPDPRGETLTALEEAHILFRLGKLEEALPAYEQVQNLGETHGDTEMLAAGLLGEAQVASRLGVEDAPLDEVRRARNLYERLGDALGQGNTWRAEGQALASNGEDEAAVAAYSRAEKIYQDAGKRSEEAESLLGKSELLERLGDEEAAIGAARQAGELYRALGDAKGGGDALRLEGEITFSFGDPTSALPLYEEARELYQAAGAREGQVALWKDEFAALNAIARQDEGVIGFRELRASRLTVGNPSRRAQTWLAEADLQLEHGREENVLHALRKARELFERIEDEQGIGWTWEIESNLLYQFGKAQEALAAARSARKLFRECGDRSGEADSWYEAANALAFLGETSSALDAVRKARRLFRITRTMSIGEGNEARTWNMEGQLLLRRGEFEEALEAVRRGRKLGQKEGVRSEEAIAWLLEALAFLHLGHPADALEANEKGRTLAQETGNDYLEGWSWLTEARVQWNVGNHDEALAVARGAKAIYQRIGTPSEKAQAALVEGDLLLALGETEAAVEALESAQELLAGTDDRLTGANVSLSQAGLLLSAGELEDAVTVALETARIFEASSARPNQRNALELAAAAHHRLGEAEKAVELASRAIELHRGVRSARTTEQQRILADQGIASAYDILVLDLLSLGRVDEALTWAERARARVLLDLFSSEAHLADAGPAELLQEEERLRNELAENQSARRKAQDRKRRQALDEERIGLLNALDRNQYERMADSPNELVAADPLDAEGIRSLAGEVGPLLVFYTTESESLGFLVRAEAPIAVETISIDRAELQRRIQGFAHDLANPLFEQRAAVQGGELWRDLIEPFVGELSEGGPLTVLPHGPFHQLPFAALPDPGGRHFFTRWSLTVAPSVSALAHARDKHRASAEDETFVAFASGQGLPLTGREAWIIAEQFGGAGTVFTPTEARFERYEEFAPSTRQLLIATRGGFAEYSIHGTYLEILPTPGVHDSRLSAAEIAAIPLDAELVVLAACDTARGRALLSDDRLDLTRAFLVAGSAAVLATRWKVPESPATTRFLVDFYRAYRTGGPGGDPIRKDEAITAARRAAIERGDPAQIWAAWVLVGDAR